MAGHPERERSRRSRRSRRPVWGCRYSCTHDGASVAGTTGSGHADDCRELVSVIEKASVQMMYAEKATRLFLQVAQEVNTLDSRVLFSDARVQADGFLKKAT